MSDIKVTQEQIDILLNNSDIEVKTVFGKCTTVAVKLKNGFILTESSACVDPANYDAELGKKLCYEHIENRLWELEGYALQKRVHDDLMPLASGSFGWAIACMKHGHKLCRRGWNGKSQYIELAKNISYRNADGGIINPNHENIGNKAIAFVGTSGVQLGWLASQADMLADDWEMHRDEKKAYICEHDWECCGANTGGFDYRCKKCGAYKKEPLPTDTGTTNVTCMTEGALYGQAD